MATPDKAKSDPTSVEGSDFASSAGKGQNLAEFQAGHADAAEEAFASATVEGSGEALPGIGRRIAGLRAQAGLTQDAVSQRISVSLTAVKAWENNRSLPRLEQAVKLADCLGVSLDTLVHGSDDLVAVPARPSMDEVDIGSLVWALDFVEKQAAHQVTAEKRAELMLFTAAEFRRAQRIPPLPEMDAELLGKALDLAEQLLRAAGAEPTSIRRVGHMLANYSAMDAYRAGREP